LVIQEKDKLYNELKAILARQPGPEVAEQLNVYQQNLKQKTRQMKVKCVKVLKEKLLALCPSVVEFIGPLCRLL
jgi:hypothetical protein